MKKFLIEILFIFAAAFVLPLYVSAADSPYGVALSWTGDSTSSMTATWRSDRAGNEVLQVVSEQQYNRSGFSGSAEFEAECRDISLDGSGVWHYEATAAELEPGTVYAYRVGGEGNWSDTAFFHTDAGGDSITFAYMGDVQPANDSASEFALWGELAGAMYELNPELSFAVLGGDIVNNGISVEQFDLFRKNAESVFSSVPLFSTAGNHESNFIGGKPELFLDYFAFPSNGPEGFEEEFYSFTAGPCHILVLNSWIFSGEQILSEEDYARVNEWIVSELRSSSADWQIVVTHIPVYAVHSDTTSAKVRENWEPIFEQYGVDLVFVGHQHVYSRSYPLSSGKIDYENGIPYIMGVSGSKFYGAADESLAERTIYDTATYQLVQADGGSLTVCTMDAEGNELDYVSVNRRECGHGFDDVAKDAWYAEAVDYVVSAGLFNGVGGGLFDPNGGMSRAMLTTVLHRYAGEPDCGDTSPFSDVADGLWYSGAIAWAEKNGIVNGVGQGLFAPKTEMTLEQFVAVLYRFAGASAEGSVPEKYGVVSPWAEEAMVWAESAGLLDEIKDELVAKRELTRAQAAAIIMTFDERVDV